MEAIPPTDTNVRKKDVKRFTGQNALILARLREGPARNYELAAIALGYRQRISDLKKHGIAILEHDGVYRLVK
jgi:hypothetical protein